MSTANPGPARREARNTKKPRWLSPPGLFLDAAAGLTGLFFVAVLFGNYWRERAEETVLFAIEAGGEKQRCGGARAAVVAEGQRPQTVDEDERIICIVAHEADKFPGEAVEGGNPAAAEITDEDGVAELAEVARGPDHAPGSVEPVAVLEAALEFAVGAEDINETAAIAQDRVVAECILPGIGNEEAAADILDVEGREATWNALVVKGIVVGTRVAE